MAPDGVRLAASQRPLGEHHAALHDLDASERRPVHARRLGRGRDAVVVEAGDRDLLPEPASGPEVASRRERAARQASPGLSERHREEMLDPAVVGERLEGRHPPVLGARRCADPEHHGRPDGKVDARVARVPEEAHVAGRRRRRTGPSRASRPARRRERCRRGRRRRRSRPAPRRARRRPGRAGHPRRRARATPRAPSRARALRGRARGRPRGERQGSRHRPPPRRRRSRGAGPPPPAPRRARTRTP